MFKILQVNSVVNRGSTGRIVEEIGDLVLKKGWQSYIAYGRYASRSTSNLIKIGSKFEIYQHVLKSRIFDRHGFSSKFATKKLIQNIENIKPDIIVLHNIHGYYLHIGFLFDYLKKLSTPVIWTLHDCWSFTGHCAYFDYVGCEKWKTHCKDCPQSHTYPKSLFIDNSFMNFKDKKDFFCEHPNLTIVTPSQWLKHKVKQSFLRQYNTLVINNGIDIEQFKVEERNHNKKQKIIILGVASIWDERKGFNDFVQLSKILDDNYQIVLIGLNDIQKNNLPNNVIGISRTESIHELVDWYNKADVFLNPTYEDNFPTTNLEALACGTPVVTYKTGGSVESICELTGIVVEKGDIHSLKEAINIIINEENKFTQLQCRERAVENFNKDDRFNEYFKLFETLLTTDINKKNPSN